MTEEKGDKMSFSLYYKTMDTTTGEEFKACKICDFSGGHNNGCPVASCERLLGGAMEILNAADYVRTHGGNVLTSCSWYKLDKAASDADLAGVIHE